MGGRRERGNKILCRIFVEWLSKTAPAHTGAGIGVSRQDTGRVKNAEPLRAGGSERATGSSQPPFFYSRVL